MIRTVGTRDVILSVVSSSFSAARTQGVCVVLWFLFDRVGERVGDRVRDRVGDRVGEDVLSASFIT